MSGPYAFPKSTSLGSDGMTLRDWFAGQALAGFTMKDPWGDPGRHAAYAYAQADAMMEERAAIAHATESRQP